MTEEGNRGVLRRAAEWAKAGARFVGVDSARSLTWLAVAFAILVALFAVQYATYGLERYLGWDTSSYVARARAIQLFGPVILASLYGFPHLYDFLVLGVGTGLGNLGLAERILPVLVGMALVALYHRMGRELFPNPDYAGLTAVLAALSVNILRFLGDLHRNLLTLTASFAFLLVLYEMVEGRRRSRPGFVLLLLFGAVAAYSQLETFAILVVSVLVFVAFRRGVRKPALAALLLPLLALAPLLAVYVGRWATFVGLYTSGEVSFGILLTQDTVLSFHGGSLPLFLLAAVGTALLVRGALRERGLWLLLLLWYATALVLLLAAPLGIPQHRLLFILPVPLLLVIPLEALHRALPRWVRWVEDRRASGRLQGHLRAGIARVLPVLAAGLVVSASIAGLAAHKDRYLQPFVSLDRVEELGLLAEVLADYQGDLPVAVLWGTHGVWMNGLELGYLGSLSGPVLTYYGRPQFLLSMTNPLLAYPNLSDVPDPTRTTALASFLNLRRVLGDNALGGERPILVDTTGLYGRPVSDYFVMKHQVGPGIYLVPPGAVSPVDRDIWVFFGAYDGNVNPAFYPMRYDWSVAPEVLEYATPTLSAPWEISYPLFLTEASVDTVLSLHLHDTPAILDEWGISWRDVHGFDLYLDGRRLGAYEYGGDGPTWVNYTMGDVAPGSHLLTARVNAVGEPFAITLDVLAFYARDVGLDTVLEAYAS